MFSVRVEFRRALAGNGRVAQVPPNWWLPAIVLCCLAMAGATASAREIVDMAGRRVAVPDQIRQIYVAFDPAAILLTSLAPDLMVGVPFDRVPGSARYLPPEVNRLPTVQGAQRADPEALLALGVDLVVAWNMRGAPDMLAAQMTAIGLPTVMVNDSPFGTYPASFRFLGQLLHREARAETLARAIEDAYAPVRASIDAIPTAQRLRVYYADSTDGLMSQCANAFRGEIVPLAGAISVMQCETPDSLGANVTISLERLLMLDPDAIVARTAAIARFVRTDPAWQHLRAVRDGRVYTFPGLPFSWVERPHSQFKILAIPWLAHQLYPDRVAFDFDQATRSFYRIFFNMELTDGDLAGLRP